MTRLLAGRLGFDSRQGQGILLFATASRPSLEPTQPTVHLVPGVLSLRAKRPNRETHHSRASSTEVKITWIYTSSPPYVFIAWCLVKHRYNFTFSSFISAFKGRFVKPT
jgi:hypothetical protein